ncbi:MAG: sulfatase-like hydrolase/transferase [Flavobacteriaceae bacterium]|nr:sulfatase-like hydrolase/transferase [Flavobacteriaceae bacterium]
MKTYKILLVFLCYVGSIFSQNTKPNIIFIMTDDQSSIPLRNSDDQNQSRPFGFNGDNKVYTPIIDDLASKGIVFNKAYVSTSICTPSRYSMLTGKYAGRSEGNSFISSFPLGKLSRIANNIELEENITNLPRLLKTVGYTTAFIGKSHIIDHDILERYTQGTDGFMAYSKTADPNNTTVSNAMKFNHDKWSNRMKEFGFDHVNAFYPGNLRELFNDNLNIHNVEYKNKAVLDFIENTNEEPFFIYYSETIPHGPAPYWTNSNGYYAGLDADVNLTAEGVLTQDYSYLPSRTQIKNEINGLSGKDPRHAWLRWFDHAVGAVVEKLKAKGKLDNTIIIITSDHGDFNKAKATNYEGGTKVPLMVYWPNGIINPRTYSELVQNIDFTTTFLDIAGVNTSNITLDGKSLKNVLTTNSTEVIHDYLFFEIGFSRAIRTKDWKYITVRYDDATNTKIANGDTFNGPNGTQVSLPYYIPNTSLGSLGAASYPLYHQKDQLFDLANDPYETTNLFELNPEKATEMRNLLRSKLLTFPNRPYQEFTDTSIDLTVAAVSNEPTSIIGKILAGYQGWFNTPTDGSNRGWNHYRGSSGKFEPGITSIDFWPDMSGADADEKYATSFIKKDGAVATVFSSTNAKTISRHFKWMNDYGIDGVFFQQFASNLRSNTPNPNANDKLVLDNIITAAKANNNRLVSVMFDLSNANATGTMVNDIKTYWQQLVTEHGLNDNTNKHLVTYNQKPIVAIWGVGFNRTDNYTLDDIQELITYFKNDPIYGGCSVLLGVPRSWRTLDNDATSNPQLHTVIKTADIVHPWTVGRYSNLTSADSHKSIIAADKAWCDAQNLLYMPVVFPGFSWQNLKKDQGVFSELNSIPRLKGDFLWRQFYNAIDENVETIYVAMFDEMDEGTCIFKVDDNPPSSALTQFTNYEGLPSDYYLWLTGKGGEALRGEIALTVNQPSYQNLPEVTNYYADEFGDDTNTGTSPGTAFLTVQKAYAIAKEGSTINISGTVIHNSKILVEKSMNFIGTDNAIISPDTNKQGTDRLFHISKPNLNVSFSDITFKGNKESSINGGAINMNANSNLTFTNSIFDDNSTGGVDKAGGGLFFSEGNITITNSIFKNNLARGDGGAISGSGDGTLTITGSLFINNTAANINKTDGNGDRANGGAINIFGDGRKVIMSKNTFYNNTATFQGGGLYFGGLNATSNLENITVFGNKVILTSAEAGEAGGIKIEGGRTFEIKNSLIYGNLLGDTVNPESDINIASGVQLNFINSLSGVSKGFGLDDTYSSSKIKVDLTSSNLRFNETSGKVEFDMANGGDDTPIDFGSDGNDAGAWDSNVTLSVENEDLLSKKILISYNSERKIIRLFNSITEPVSIEIYNLLGSRILALNNIGKQTSINANAFKNSIYILIAKVNSTSFSKKFILY